MSKKYNYKSNNNVTIIKYDPSSFGFTTAKQIREITRPKKGGVVSKKRETHEMPSDTVVKNMGVYKRRILIGTPTLGVVRIEWVSHRKGQIIPINWTGGDIQIPYLQPSFASVGYNIADAQNIITNAALTQDYEWLLLWEDDVLPPFDALCRFDDYMSEGNIPIVAGLYYTKSDPSSPLIFKGRGSGCFTDFKLGEKVWVDGICTGFTLIHCSILRWLWEHSPWYTLPDGQRIRQVFEQPHRVWTDPENNTYFAELGTTDLVFCNRVIKEEVLSKTGWSKVAKQEYPFLVDTSIFCYQIDLQGRLYPQNARRIVGPKVFS